MYLYVYMYMYIHMYMYMYLQEIPALPGTWRIWTFLFTAGFRVEGNFLRPTEQQWETFVGGVRVLVTITEPRRARATQTHAHVVVAVPVVQVVHSSTHPCLIIREVVPDPALAALTKACERLLSLIQNVTTHSCTRRSVHIPVHVRYTSTCT